MSHLNNFTLHQHTAQDGCFTFESSIIDQNIMEIARRLGLPQSRVQEGIYIAYALTIPDLDGFELGGVAIDSTDKFVSYKRGIAQYDMDKFRAIYKGLKIQEFKKNAQQLFISSRLVKVICKIPHEDGLHYPEGSMVQQFIMLRKIPCFIAAEIPPMGTYHH